jgi:hypothetical protein
MAFSDLDLDFYSDEPSHDKNFETHADDYNSLVKHAVRVLLAVYPAFRGSSI